MFLIIYGLFSLHSAETPKINQATPIANPIPQPTAKIVEMPSMSNKYENFLKDLRSAPGVISVDREYATLWVQVPGSQEFQARGQEFADMISQWYKAEMGQEICVRTYYGNRRTIGNSCKW